MNSQRVNATGRRVAIGAGLLVVVTTMLVAAVWPGSKTVESTPKAAPDSQLQRMIYDASKSGPPGSAAYAADVHGATLKSVRRTKPGYIACTSDQAFKDFSHAVASKDSLAVHYSLAHGCYDIAGDLPLSVLDRGWATVHFRVYIGDSAAELWGPVEIVQEPSA